MRPGPLTRPPPCDPSRPRAARTDRAAVAVRPGAGDEHRPCRVLGTGHQHVPPVPHLLRAQRRLLRLLGLAVRLAVGQEQQPRPSRLHPCPDELVERAERGRELVDGQLVVLGSGLRRGGRLPRLDVDDDRTPLVVTFEPVDPTAQPDPTRRPRGTAAAPRTAVGVDRQQRGPSGVSPPETVPPGGAPGRRPAVVPGVQVQLHRLLDGHQLQPSARLRRTQSSKAASISRTRTSSRRPNHGAPVSSRRHADRSASSSSAGSAPAARAWTSACTREPVTADSAPVSSPPCRDSTHRRGSRQSSRRRRERSGRALLGAQRAPSDSSATPYQSSGWAPGTPSAASRASWVAAR